jgi:nitrous oxidase accessory protein NosD
VIYNNTIFNITSTLNSASAIHLLNSRNTTIRNNTIEKISSTSTTIGYPQDAFGIRIHNSRESNIINTRIRDLKSSGGSGYGIIVDSSRRSTLNDSSIDDINSKSSYGIHVDGSSTTVIKNNTITDLHSSALTNSGISLEDSPNSQVLLNNITTLTAEQPEVNGISLDHCTGALVGNNTIQSFSTNSLQDFAYGLNLKVSSSVVIEWNDLSNISSNSEAIGISTENSESLIIRYNSIADLSPSHGLYIINCSDTVLTENVLTDVQNWIYIDETSENVQYSENTVDGDTITLESFTRPADLIIEEGDINSSISWNAMDSQAQSYAIFQDGILKSSGQWISTSSIDHNINYSLSIGQHTYQIVLTESLTGFNITDDVKVTVVEMDPPQVVQSPDDLYLGIGTTDEQTLSWTLTDNYPATYVIYKNGTEDSPVDSWTSSDPINFKFYVPGVDEYTVYNYTLMATDISGNTVNDTVLVYIGKPVEIITSMPSNMKYIYEETGDILNLNWTVLSDENGTYSIIQDFNTIKTVIDSGVFDPGEPILYQININDLDVGTYNFSLKVNQAVEAYIIVTVEAKPEIPGAQEITNRSSPHYSIPPYLTRPPNPLPALFGAGFFLISVFILCIAGYWYITRRLMVPSAVKDEQNALKKARDTKDMHEEGKRLGAIGRIYFEAGNIKNANSNHKKALEIFRKTGDKKFQIQELESLGNAYLEQGVEET